MYVFKSMNYHTECKYECHCICHSLMLSQTTYYCDSISNQNIVLLHRNNVKRRIKNPFSSWCIIESWRACILSNLNSAKTIISNEDLELLCNLATLQVFYTMSLNVIDHRKRVKYLCDKKRYIGSRVSLVKIRRFNPSICLEYLGG